MGKDVCAPCKQFTSEEKTNEIEEGKNLMNPTNIFINEKEDMNKDNNWTNRYYILNTMSGGMDQNTFLEKCEKQLPLLRRKITETDFNNLIPKNLYTYLTNNPYLLDSATNNNNNLKNKKILHLLQLNLKQMEIFIQEIGMKIYELKDMEKCLWKTLKF